MKDIAGIRKDYTLQTLDESDTDADPVKQFSAWWQQATESNIDEVNAMTLSTVSENNQPASRIVLLKGFDENGFVFFTNYESHKSADIETNPKISLLFFWKELQRQVRIEGVAKKTSTAVSDEYFNSRPALSKIGAWASPQSRLISSREVLEKNETAYEIKFAGKKIPRPPHWGGYLVKPRMMEFWQGRAGRLHDRIIYTAQENNSWKKERLAP